MTTRLRDLARARRGVTGIMLAVMMPVLIGAAAFAIDLGNAALQTRRLQGMADAAALIAANDPSRAETLARQSVGTAGWPGPVEITGTAGRYANDASVSPAARFAAGGPAANAVRVRLSAEAPGFFARIFGIGAIPIARTATAARIDLASFSIGSRLAALDGGALNGLLSALTGSTVSLSVMDYDAMAGADIDVFGLLDALKGSGGLKASTYSDVLAAKLTPPALLSGIAARLDAEGNGPAAVSVRRLAAQAGGGGVALGTLIDAGPYAAQSSGGTGLAKVGVLQLVTAALETATPNRQIGFDVGTGVPGAATTHVSLAIGDRQQQSPWITITARQTPVLHTAQARLYAETTLPPATLDGIAGAVSLKVPIYVELAGAEAHLDTLACASQPASVTIAARTDPGSAAIAAVDPARLPDFTTPVPLAPATLLSLPLVTATGFAQIATGSAEPWQSLGFTADDVANGRVRTISSSAPLAGVARSLAGSVAIDVRVAGLAPTPTAPLAAAIGNRLALSAPALDTLLDTVTGALGVRYGQADVRATGLRCGVPALVG